MKRLAKISFIALAMISLTATTFASDWDIAGKVLTGIEGLRLLSGGRVDILGGMTGINNTDRYAPRSYSHTYVYVRDDHDCRRTWVPGTVWRKEWVPGHWEYDPQYGEIFIEGYYREYLVEEGGSWKYNCRDYHHYPSRDSHRRFRGRY